MVKKSSSTRWLNEHNNDFYVKQAKKDGYRSRAVYKLLELVEKNNFIKSSNCVLDLGSSPGSWSQLAKKIVGKKGIVIANDILPMQDISGVDFIQGDFKEDDVYKKILSKIPSTKFDVVLSDMAPNMSGHLSIDAPKSMYLAELALNIAIKSLNNNGYFCVKIFQGQGFDIFVKQVKEVFTKVIIKKPKASKKKNREVYLLARKLKKSLINPNKI